MNVYKGIKEPSKEVLWLYPIKDGKYEMRVFGSKGWESLQDLTGVSEDTAKIIGRDAALECYNRLVAPYKKNISSKNILMLDGEATGVGSKDKYWDFLRDRENVTVVAKKCTIKEDGTVTVDSTWTDVFNLVSATDQKAGLLVATQCDYLQKLMKRFPNVNDIAKVVTATPTSSVTLNTEEP